MGLTEKNVRARIFEKGAFPNRQVSNTLKGVGYLFIGEMNTQYIEYLHVSFS